MNNYWVRRIKEEENLTFNKSKKLIEDIQETYKKAYKKIKSSIDELEVLIRNNKMELDMLEASKLLTIEEKKELEKSIKETLKGYEDLANSIDYKKYKKDIKEIYKFKSLQNMGYNSRITRLKAKQMEIEAILTSLSKKQDIMLTKHLKEVYEDTYYKTAYINSLQKGSFENINKLDFDGVIKAVKQSWTVDGINFSKRIWKNSATISKEISKEIIVNIAIGKGVRNLSEKISKKYNVALYQASRLVQTETSAIRNRATLDRYKEEGIEKYQIIAVLDSKTSKICQSMDMKIFNTKDQVIGVNYPPFHINCRSTTKAYFEFLEDNGTRKARLPDNTIQDIPSKMNYNEWYDKYVKSSPEQLKYEKMNKYRSKDMEQYQLYKEVLGNKNIPKNFDLFQELKYNDIDNWELTKREFKTINSIKNKGWTDVFKSKAIDTYYKFREENIEVSDHFLSRFLNSGRNHLNLSIDDVVMLKHKNIKFKEFNLKKSEYNYIRYEIVKNNYVRLISNEKDNELISIIIDEEDVSIKKKQSKKWEVYK